MRKQTQRMEPPETRYARAADGVHIAYQVLGGGPADLVFIAGFTSHVEHQWEQPTLADSLRRMASFSRLILFDKRGTGLSGPVPASQHSLEQRMEDMTSVLDAVGSECAALFRASDGGLMCALFAATHPERVSHLILYGSWARFLRAADYPIGVPEEAFGATMQGAFDGWGSAVGLPLIARRPWATPAWRRGGRAGSGCRPARGRWRP
jgi:pimeloyl-ACP methyl ester carboxylesterase